MVIGVHGRSVVATLVERTTWFLVLVPLTGRDSLTVRDAIITAVGDLPAPLKRSLTWDCGAEMAGNARITAKQVPVYFATRTPWQPGSNENLNWIVREYFPKSTAITQTATTQPPSPPRSTTGPVESSAGRTPPSCSPNSSQRMLPPTDPATITSPTGTVGPRPFEGHQPRYTASQITLSDGSTATGDISVNRISELNHVRRALSHVIPHISLTRASTPRAHAQEMVTPAPPCP